MEPIFLLPQQSRDLLGPGWFIVRTFTKAGYEAIQKSIGDAALAQNIYWDKTTGLIDINREFETDNLNYLRLWYLVSSPQEIVVSVTDRVSYIDRRNEIKASIITPLQETGIQGLTVFPSDGRPEAVNVHYRDYILCAISPFLDKSAMGMTLAHELYGHAFLYVRNRPFQHELGKTGGFDPQGYVNRYIMRIEERRY